MTHSTENDAMPCSCRRLAGTRTERDDHGASLVQRLTGTPPSSAVTHDTHSSSKEDIQCTYNVWMYGCSTSSSSNIMPGSFVVHVVSSRFQESGRQYYWQHLEEYVAGKCWSVLLGTFEKAVLWGAGMFANN